MDEYLNQSPSLELLTDEAILDFTSDPQGNQRVLTDHRDANLKNKPFKPWENGPYDVNIFGSPYIDQCLCGKVRQVSEQPCPVCGSKVYPIEEALRRFARIELPFYYLNDSRFELFQDFFNDVFKNTRVSLNFANPDLRVGGYSNSRSSRRLGIKVFDSCQFNYSKKKGELVVSEFITDESKCSYEGLLKILEKDFPDRVSDFKKIVNKLYLVQPAVIRPFTLTVSGGKRVLGSSRMSIWYSAIIRLCCPQDKAANELNYDVVMSKFNTPGERVRYTALLRALLNSGKKEATELLNTSKENLSRILYSVRTENSARCPIVPSTTLKIDEVSVPIHIAYEMCRSGFVKHLMNELNFTEKEALRSTRDEFDNPEIRRLFKEYAEKQLVMDRFSA